MRQKSRLYVAYRLSRLKRTVLNFTGFKLNYYLLPWCRAHRSTSQVQGLVNFIINNPGCTRGTQWSSRGDTIIIHVINEKPSIEPSVNNLNLMHAALNKYYSLVCLEISFLYCVCCNIFKGRTLQPLLYLCYMTPYMT